MSLKLIDIYNDVAAQPWSMFDSEVENHYQFDSALLLSINKALLDIWTSFPFSFRIKSHSISTIPSVLEYPAPQGLILNNSDDIFSVSLDNKNLIFLPDSPPQSSVSGMPEYFWINQNSICFSPTPNNIFIIDVRFLSLAYSINATGPVFSLKNSDDVIDIPSHLDNLFKNALITKTMLYAISSKSDEIYSGYKEQFEKAYKLLIKYSTPVCKIKKVII